MRVSAMTAVVLVLVLAGCATSPRPVTLRHPQTGRMFTCSGDPGTSQRWWDEDAKRIRDNCVRELEGQGYQVVK